jgi:FkbM family methyltransferase
MSLFGKRGRLTREHVIWAYRLLLDRDPESEDVIGPKLAGSRDTRELRHHLMTSAEFQIKNPDYAHTNDSTPVIKELRDHLRLFVDLSDHVIGLNIIRDRYEQGEIRYVRSILKPGDTAVDAGAHIGFFSMHMADAVGPSGIVYAFEPFESNARLLERSIHENRFEDRVVLRRAAVGATTRTSTLTFPNETLNTGGAYLLREGAEPAAGHRTRTVDVVALDQLPLRHPVRFIKMDVEGAEPHVVRGAAATLENDRPVVMSEVHPAQLERVSASSVESFLAELRAAGYRAHRLEGGKVGPPFEHASRDVVASIAFLPN